MLADGPAEQAEALETLEAAGSAAAPVLAAVLQDRQRASAAVRCLAAELLGKVGAGAEATGTSLIAALQDPDAHVRSVASAALPKAGVSADVAVPALLELIGRERNPVHVRALSEYREAAQPGLPVLEEILADSQLDSETRWNAARAIGKVGAEAAGAVPSLVAALQDPAATIREHAAEALGDIGPPAAEAVPGLASVLDDPAPRVRRKAVRALGQIGQPARAVLTQVQTLLKDKEDIVRAAAQKTLQTIAPETLPAKPEAEKPDTVKTEAAKPAKQAP
jgi:HEAT repeat protein